MKNLFIRKNIFKVLALSVAIIAMVIIGNIFYNQWFFFAKSATPRNHSTASASTKQAIITFNKELDPNQDIYKDIRVDPQRVIYHDIKINKNTLIINFASLDIDIEYSLIFKEIRSTDGKVINDFVYQIKTEFVPFGDMSQADREKDIGSINSGDDSDKALTITPHSTLDYTIERAYRTGHDGSAYLVLSVTILLTGSDRGNEAAATEKYKSQALEYLRSNGVNPEDYIIEYEVNSAIF